jgi:purine nucleoside phosphorylase
MDGGLDASVFPALAELERRGARRPACLVLGGAGLGHLPTRLARAGRLPLSALGTTPEPWRDALLHWGELNGLGVWLLEDEHVPCSAPAWARTWPVWLAAGAGAVSLVCSAGACALDETPLGTFALACDHLDFGGESPLAGLGESRLGPMFPDTSRLHDDALRRAALAECERLGLAAREAIVACTPAPALETPAEQAWHRSAGAQVSVQGLGAWLSAAAHAGLGALAVALVVARAGERLDVARVLAAARELSPALDDLLWSLAGRVPALALGDLEGRVP